MKFQDKPGVAGVIRIAADSALVWQVGVDLASGRDVSPEEARELAGSIDFGGRRFRADLVAGSGETYVRAAVVPASSLESVATTERALYELPASMEVTAGGFHVLVGPVGIPDREWTDEEMCLWRGEVPSVFLEAEKWWIAAYRLQE